MLMLAVIAVVRAIQFTVKYCFVFVDCFVVNGRFYEYCEGKTELLCSESADVKETESEASLVSRQQKSNHEFCSNAI